VPQDVAFSYQFKSKKQLRNEHIFLNNVVSSIMRICADLFMGISLPFEMEKQIVIILLTDSNFCIFQYEQNEVSHEPMKNEHKRNLCSHFQVIFKNSPFLGFKTLVKFILHSLKNAESHNFIFTNQITNSDEKQFW